MGIFLALFWPLMLVGAIVELPFAALENVLGPFADAAGVWADYFSNMF